VFKPSVPPPLPITWEMKELSSADAGSEQLTDGRMRYRIEHDLIRGVTPEMLVWWFRTFPSAKLAWNGELVSMYRIWHPRDHIRCTVLLRLFRRAEGPGVSKGATVVITERLGPKVTRTRARVAQMDEGGLRLVVRRLGLKVGDLHHSFERTADGTLYRSELLIGSSVPGIGRLVNALARRLLFPPEVGRAWVTHNVEEVGNFQFFLPKLYEEAPAQRT
jgi:DAPG hydrolase PhiG domain